jgi:uncharacterized protein YbjT (DUF2867 family)
MVQAFEKAVPYIRLENRMRPAEVPAAAPAPILVTGATGTVGRHVVDELLGAGVPVRAAVTPPSRGVVLARHPGVDPGVLTEVVLDLTDPATWADAFAGVERMFLLRPPHLARPRRQMVPALEHALGAGVRRIAFLSIQGAERNPVVPHHVLERWLVRSGVEWTMLRAAYFMQNLATTHRDDVRRGEIVVPAGRARTALVDARDVAAMAARVLVEEGHGGRAYTPTSREALRYDECAHVLSDVLGREVRYTRPGAVRYLRHAVAQGMRPGMAGVTLGIYGAARLGLARGLTDDVASVLGRESIGLRRFAEDHVAVWR